MELTEIVRQDTLPIFLQLNNQGTTEEFVAWFRENETDFTQKLQKAGAVLIRGLDVNSASRFQQLMQSLFPSTRNFLDGNSSRGKYTKNVYNASEYDASSIIQLHTEFSYSNIWPEIICFCCEIRADEGGQTTVGDCRKVLELLDPAIVEEFSKKGITYIRNLHGGGGLGPSWMEAFESDDKNFIQKYCDENNIVISWNKDNSLKLVQTRPAIRKHPHTQEDLWFNQVDQFYPQIYGEEVYDTLLALAGNNPEALPMYARYGDGSEIQKAYIEQIIEVLHKITVPVEWEPGDLLVVDNMLALHGRLPYKGKRKILVSMA